MDTKMLVAGLLGGVTLFLMGALVYVLLLADFFAVSVAKDPPDFIFIILGELVLGCLLAWLIAKRNISTPATGAQEGALIGFLIGLGIGFLMYGSTTIGDLVYYLVDAVVWAVRWAAAGAVIGWWLGRGGSE